MILHRQLVEQTVDRSVRGRFLKELVLARGTWPLAMVRKRLAQPGAQSTRDGAVASRAVLLLIHGYAQNRYAFHLPSRSWVNQLALAGYDVFNIDLRGRGRSSVLGARRPNHVLDFIREDVPAALEEIQRLAGPQPVFLIGHSLGGIVSYCVASDARERVAGVVSVGSPYHFALGSRWLTAFAYLFTRFDARVPLPNAVIPARSYGRLVRAARRVMDSRFTPLPFRGFHPGSMEPHVLEEHMRLAMDRGSIATMREMFGWAEELRARRHGSDGLFGYAPRFEALDVPLLVIAGLHDDLAPPASVRPAWERSQSTDRKYREFPAGHIDLLVGRDAPATVWPLVGRWLDERARA